MDLRKVVNEAIEKNLTVLGLGGNQISKEDKAELQKALPNTRIFF